MQRKAKILILEPLGKGHRLHYVSLISSALKCHDIQLLTSPAALETEEAQLFVHSSAKQFSICKIGNGEEWNYAFLGEVISEIRSISERGDAYVIIIPYADSATLSIVLNGLLRFRMWGYLRNRSLALYMRRCGVYYDSRSPIVKGRRAFSYFLSSVIPWKVIFELDGRKQHRHWGPDNRNWTLPDPAEVFPMISKKEARLQLCLPVDGLIVGMIGGVNRVKNPDLLVRTLWADCFSDVKLVLAGRHDPFTRDLVKQVRLQDGCYSRRIIQDDSFYPLEKMHLWLSAMDIVLTPYGEGHVGSSSIVIRAAKAGRPVLGSDQGWMGEMIPKFGLGWTCDVRSEEVFAVALEDALRTYPNWKPGEGSQRFCDFHSVDNFAKHWRYAVDQILEGSSDERPLFWSEVAT